MSTLRAGATRDVVLIVIAVILLIGAGLYFKTGGGSQDAPPDDQYLSFHCPVCDHAFRMSYEDFEKYWNERSGTLQEDGRTMLFECPECGEHKSTRVFEP